MGSFRKISSLFIEFWTLSGSLHILMISYNWNSLRNSQCYNPLKTLQMVKEQIFQHDFNLATEGVLKKKVLLKFRKIHRKTPVPEPLFNKVLMCFHVNLSKFLRTPFLENTSRHLLLSYSALIWFHSRL